MNAHFRVDVIILINIRTKDEQSSEICLCSLGNSYQHCLGCITIKLLMLIRKHIHQDFDNFVVIIMVIFVGIFVGIFAVIIVVIVSSSSTSSLSLLL